MRRSSTDETPYRRSPSLDSKPETPPFTSGFHRFSGEFEYKRPPFAFGFHTTKGPQTSKGRYAQGKKYVVFYLDLSFIFLLELRRCRMAEGCMMALRYGMVFFNLLFWVSYLSQMFLSLSMCEFGVMFVLRKVCTSLTFIYYFSISVFICFRQSPVMCVCATKVIWKEWVGGGDVGAGHIVHLDLVYKAHCVGEWSFFCSLYSTLRVGVHCIVCSAKLWHI